MADYDIFREQLAIKYPSYGHALWEPSPKKQDRPVRVGDVGFIRRGKFHRLFNAMLPENDPSHERGVPEYHEPLVPTLSDHLDTGFLSRNNYCSAGVSVEADQGYYSSGPDDFRQVSFRYNRYPGAAVISLPVKARREDTLAQGDFRRWIVRNIDSWFAFAQTLGLGIEQMEEIVLVTGCHHTRSWTNVAFLGNQADAQVSFGVKVERADTSINFQFSPENARGAVVSQGPEGTDLPENQCLFIRGFRVARTFWILRRRIKAAGGPSPDLDGFDCDPDAEVMSIPAIKYRDPLHLLLEYLAEQASDCEMVLAHDDDLVTIGGLGHDAPLETLEPEVMMDLLRRSNIEIDKEWCDLSPTDSGPNTLSVVKVAMLSTTSENWSNANPSQWTSFFAENIDLGHTNESSDASTSSLPGGLPISTDRGDTIKRETSLLLDNSDSVPSKLQDSADSAFRVHGVLGHATEGILLALGKIKDLPLNVLPSLSKRDGLLTIVAVTCCAVSLLGWVFSFTWDVIFRLFTLLLASFLLSIWFERECTYCRRLDGRFEALQQHILSLQLNLAVQQNGTEARYKEVVIREFGVAEQDREARVLLREEEVSKKQEMMEAEARIRDVAIHEKEEELLHKEAEAKNREAEAKTLEAEVVARETEVQCKEEEVHRRENEALHFEQRARQALAEAERLEAGARQAETSAKMLAVAAQARETEVRSMKAEVKKLEVEAQDREARVRFREEEASKKEEVVRLLEEKAQQTLEEAKHLDVCARRMETEAKMRELAAKKTGAEALQREAQATKLEALAQTREAEALVRETEAQIKEEEAFHKARQALEEAKQLESVARQAEASAEMHEELSQKKETEARDKEVVVRKLEVAEQDREAKVRLQEEFRKKQETVEAEAKMRDAAIRKKEAEVLRKEAKAKTREAEAQTREAKAVAWETEVQYKEEEVHRRENEALHLEEQARQALAEAKRLEAGARQAETSANMFAVAAQARETEVRSMKAEVKKLEVEAQDREARVRFREEEASKKEEVVRLLEEKAQQTLEEAKHLDVRARRMETEAKLRALANRKREAEVLRKEAEAEKREAQAQTRKAEALAREKKAQRKEEDARLGKREASRLKTQARQALEEAERYKAGIRQAEASAKMQEEAVQQREAEARSTEVEAKKLEGVVQDREVKPVKPVKVRLREEEASRKEEKIP